MDIGGRRRMGRRWGRLALAGGVVVGSAGLLFEVVPAGAALCPFVGTGPASCTATQAVAVTAVGALAVAVPPASASVSVPTAGAGLTSTANLGPLTVVDSLADATPWSVTVASPACTSAGAATIPNGNLTFTPGGWPAGVTPGAAGALSGPVTVGSDSTDVATNGNDGAFTQTGANTLAISLPANQALTAYTCTLTYTVTG